MAEVTAALRSGWVTQGPRVAAFEEAFARRVGARAAIAVSSGTSGLHLALVALGVGPGDEVIVPTMTFIATANAVVHAGARPVLADVDERTFNMGPSEIERAIGPRTRAIVCVDQIGLPCDLDGIAALARSRGLIVVEDAACAVGARYRGRPVGTPSAGPVVFSFHPRKTLTTGEGGMVTTDDEALAERLRLLRQHGMSIDAHARARAAASGVPPRERFDVVGWNYRMSDVHAAIGLVQLARLDELLARRRAQARRYDEAFAAPRLLAPLVPDGHEHTHQTYQLLLGDGAPPVDDVIAHLARRRIASRRGVMLCHREAPYADPAATGFFPQAERAWERAIILPLFHDMTDEEQARVIAAVREAAG